MRNNIKTARGSMIDMAALAAKHETTRAVGNIPMNARGDRLNGDGTVKVSAEAIAVAHQNAVEPPQQQPISDPKPIEQPAVNPTPPKAKNPQPAPAPDPEIPNLEEQFSEEPEAISKITRTRDDGTKYVEIEYDDGSIETLEINTDEE
jgi:outer membrane biosynthesis protein TonB